MKEIKGIKSTFSLFGNFSKLNGRESDLKKTFEGYQSQVQNETLPNGVSAKSYHFVKNNTGVIIRAYRIDLEYGYANDEDGEANFLAFVKEASTMLNNLDTIKGNRIALNAVEFVPNDNGDLVKKCNDAFNISSLFGSQAKEVNVRVNHVHNIMNEEFNSVLIIQDGNVTHNVTKEKTECLFVNKDINSLASNTTIRFNIADAYSYATDLVLEAKERTVTFIKNLE